jgi:hypothetical protein
MPPTEPEAEATPSPAKGHARGPRHVRLPRGQLRRGLYALIVIAVVLTIGTVGLHVIAGSTWVDSFYFESMLATGQGPPFPLNSDSAKLFAVLMAFVSIGSVVSAILLTLGPLMIGLWKEGVEIVQDEAREVKHEVFHRRERPKGPP